MFQPMNETKSTIPSKPSGPDVIIDTPLPNGVNVDYLKETFVPIGVTNKTNCDIVVEGITEKFSTSPESDKKDDGIIRYECPAKILKPRRSDYWNIKIVPNLFFQANTNSYRVTVTYRKDEGGRRSSPIAMHNLLVLLVISSMERLL